jgi:hypothetical protein
MCGIFSAFIEKHGERDRKSIELPCDLAKSSYLEFVLPPSPTEKVRNEIEYDEQWDTMKKSELLSEKKSPIIVRSLIAVHPVEDGTSVILLVVELSDALRKSHVHNLPQGAITT